MIMVQQPQIGLKFRLIDTFGSIHTPHVVQNNRHRKARENGRHIRDNTIVKPLAAGLDNPTALNPHLVMQAEQIFGHRLSGFEFARPEWSGLDLPKNLIIFLRKFSSTLGVARNVPCWLLLCVAILWPHATTAFRPGLSVQA